MPSARPTTPVREQRTIISVFGDVRGKLLDRLRISCFPHVVVHVPERPAPEAEQPRAVGIGGAVGERVMLAMDGDPFLAALARRQPEHRPKEHVRARARRQRAVRKGAVQVDGRRDDRGLGQCDGDDRDDPTRESTQGDSPS